MKTLASLFNKEFSAHSYHCAHFVRDVLVELGEIDVEEKLSGLYDGLVSRGETDVAEKLNKFSVPCWYTQSIQRRWRRLFIPETPCVAVLRDRKAGVHVGVWLDGDIVHLNRSGPQCLPADTVSETYESVRYYKAERPDRRGSK